VEVVNVGKGAVVEVGKTGDSPSVGSGQGRPKEVVVVEPVDLEVDKPMVKEEGMKEDSEKTKDDDEVSCCCLLYMYSCFQFRWHLLA
jgi:hypothetical protein